MAASKTKDSKVIGLAPLTFVSEDAATAGQQYHIPLSALNVDAKGAIDASDWTPEKGKKLAATDAELLKTIIADLQRRGVLSTS